MATFGRYGLLAAMQVSLFALSGCAGANPGQGYRLQQINAQYFLLPPPAEEAAERRTVHIPADVRAAPAAGCSVEGHWFALSRAAHDKFWTANMPTATAWEKSAGAVDMKDEWESFASAVYGLRQKDCFSGKEYVLLQQTLVANLPAPADEVLFYRYGYGIGGYVNLAPGMQLRIERDFFAGDAPSSRAEDYRGTTITTYAIVADDQNGVRLTFLGIEKKSAGGRTPVATTLDANLASQFSASSHLRLFLQDLEVSGNAKTPAILVGAANEQDLHQATRQVTASAQACAGPLGHVTCAIFHGTVTVSPMLQITANGKPTYLPIGSKLWSVLPLDTSRDATVLRTLRVERPYEGRMVAVAFPHDQESLAQILVAGGDRISWSKGRRKKQ